MLVIYLYAYLHIIDFTHVKQGKGGEFVRTKMKNIITKLQLFLPLKKELKIFSLLLLLL